MSGKGNDERGGKAGGGGEAAAVVVLGMNLDELVAEVAQFDPDGAVGGLDGLFLPAEGTAFDAFHAQTKGGGFAEDKGSEFFGIGGKGKDGEEVARAAFFHDQRGDGGVEGACGHEAVDGMGEVFPGDVIQMGPDLHHCVGGGSAGGRGATPKGAEDVGTFRQIAGAKSVADLFRSEGVERAEFFHKVGEDGGAGGGGEFVRHVELANGDAAEVFGGGGGGEREFSMGALDGPGAVDRDGGGDLPHFEVVDAGGGADEIDDRVDGAHLVEVDSLNRHAMKLGLGLGDAMEHGEGGVAHLRGELGFFQKIMDIRPVPAVMVVIMVMMMMVVSGLLDQKAGAGETAADGFLGIQDHLFREVKGLDSFLKKRQGHAKVEQGGAEHVATDAGGAVEMEVGRHGCRILKIQAGIEGGSGEGGE